MALRSSTGERESKMAVNSILHEFADGYWKNLAARASPWGFVLGTVIGIKVGMAISRGWLEQRDDTWVRLTMAGRAELERISK